MMKALYSVLGLVLFSVWSGRLLAQPPNDDCVGATLLTLTTPAPCPSTTPVSNTFSFSNVNATPTSPYPQLTGCAVGGTMDAPASEVWFVFQATANVMTFEITGLNTPNMALFFGNDCAFLQGVDCGSANPGSGNLTVTRNVLVGETYYLLISGGDVDDQGPFTLEITSQNNCNPCLLGNNFISSPPPQNGTYASGQTVQFCFTITSWDITSTIEWLHSIQVDFGPGWDVSSLVPIPPPSCDGNGFWAWYDSWTGCVTGQNFGPGFAYESVLGIACGGTPGDGDPGNNYGDGTGGCQQPGITSPPVTFCWQVTVADCQAAGNFTGNDLSMSVQVFSDGDSGSWTQTGCNSGATFDLLASAVCCDDPDPIVTPVPTSCPGASDGSIQILPGAGIDPAAVYNVFVFNSANVIVYQCLGCTGTVIADNLPAGNYSVQATNVASNCGRSANTTISDSPPPVATASNGGPYCPGDQIMLFADPPPAIGNTYSWTGPGGYSSNQANPTDATLAGTYTLQVNVAGCPADPVTTTVVIRNAMVTASAMPTAVCPNGTTTLSANGNVVSYDWGPPIGTGQVVTTPPLTSPTTFTVLGTDAFGCTVTASVDVDVLDPPQVTINAPFTICAGEPAIITASAIPAQVNFTWDDGSTGPIFVINNPTPPSETVVVTGVDPLTGCQTIESITIPVTSPPNGVITPDLAIICAGETATLTASGGNSYQWSTSLNQAQIQVSPAVSTNYTVTVTDFNGCTDVVTASVFVEDPLEAPAISCGPSTPTSVEFNWQPVANAGGYSVEVLTNQTGVLNGTTFTVDGLAPGEVVTIQVTAQSNTDCPDSQATFTCTAQECAPIDVTIDPVDDFCLYPGVAPDTLAVAISGGLGGSGVWSGTGITDPLLGIFDPLVADTGINEVIYTYTEGICDYPDTIQINVFAVPTADFVLDTNAICSTDSVTVTYAGSAATDQAVFDWDFAGGTAVAGTAPEQYFVSWPSAGQQVISLTVTENGCISEVFTNTVDIQAPLTAPVVTCGPATTTSVEFSWNDVPDATGYNVDVSTGQTGVLSGTTYTVNNLSPGEVVTITVTAENDGPCGPVSTEQTCTAADCPAFVINIDPVADICLDGTDQSLDLAATVSGGDGSGVLTWSGPGITDGALGSFDPATAGVGAHVITATYTEGPCSDSETITISVFNTPTADFTVDPASICLTGATTVTYTGTAGPGATYNWSFNGGVADPGTGPGPHTVSWPTAGLKAITLTVQENGCTSPVFSETAEVLSPLPAPVVSCGPATTTSVEFSWNDVPGATGYSVDVSTGQSGVLSGTTYTVDNLLPGEVVTITVTAENDGPCGPSSAEHTCVAADCPVFIIDIDPVDDICLNGTDQSFDLSAAVSGGGGTGVLTWSGPGITDGALGSFDPATAGVGAHVITATYTEGPCSDSETITINVFATPTADFTATPDNVCIGDEVQVTYTGTAGPGATYTWNFNGGTADPGTGPGPHQVSWATAGAKNITLTVVENGCASAQFSRTVTVESPLPAPVINCNTTTSSITFTWNDVPGAIDYEVEVLTGQTGVQTGNTFTVDGLVPGDEVEIEVTALGDGPCGNSSAQQNCIAEDCPMVSITFDPVDAICLDASAAPLTLNATVTGGNGGGTESWSGPGITDPAAGVFDPNQAGVGSHVINFNYQEGNCTYNNSLTIVVNEQPTADFTADSPVCVDETSTVNYTGSASAPADYQWDFGGGSGDPGAGQGPHEVSWPTGGLQTVSLVVTENNCASEPFSLEVQVDEPLPAPVIDCDPTTSSITFTWDDVPGAVGYGVTVLSGQTGVQSGNSITIDGLDPGDEVTVRVIALGDGACGNSSTEFSCIASDCPPATISFAAVPNICLDATAAPFNLSATVDGVAGGGTESWSGPGITDGVLGTFDPSLAGAGSHTITYTYQENNCEYTDQLIIEVIQPPTADFTVQTPICADGTSLVTYTGTAAATATFNWDFDGGTAIPGTGAGPHTVDWAAGGIKDITLTVTENDCPSEPFSAQVQVDDPLPPLVFDCEATNTSVTFSWQPVPGATSYEVVVLQGPAGVLSGTTYAIDGLNPNDEVIIEVTAVSGNTCADVSGEFSCVANACPEVTLTIDDVPALCTDSDLITLAVTAAGGVGGGNFLWSGPGITDGAAGLFDPALAGSGVFTVTVTYTEDVCVYSETVEVTVNEVPTADFTVASPICLDGTAVVAYTGSAGPGATYAWNFDGGMADPGTGAGPHTVSWSTSGDKTITLTVTENGCVSETFSQTIQVDEPLTAPQLSCETSTTTIVFSWPAVAGATTYDVVVLQGPDGVLEGTTYSVDGLTPGDEVTIQVTAVSGNACADVSSEISCVAEDCPALTVTVDGPAAICAGDPAIVTFTATGSTGGPYTISYEVNGTANTLTLTDEETLSLDLTETSLIEIISVTDASLPACTYPGNSSLTITVNQPVDAGVALDPARVCAGDQQVIDLAGLLQDADTGGQWAETSGLPSSGGAFNAGAATFDPSSQAPGTYTFRYALDAADPCPDQSAEVTVIIEPIPTADAGEDQELTCNMGMVSLGGAATSTGPGITYAWTADDPDIIITNPNQPMIDVSQAGTYTLTVTNEIGCPASDEVVVTADFEVPVAEVSISGVTCFQYNDGSIIVENVTGGTPPYEFALNGGPFTTQTSYTFLSPNMYVLTIRDQNGCFSELTIDLSDEPEELIVTIRTNLEGDPPIINLGDSLLLEAVWNPGVVLDTIIWEPDTIARGNSTAVWVSPDETSTYSVTIIDENGCTDSDQATVFVKKERPVYIPSAFSPNEDGVNDILYIQAGPQVKEVKQFYVFNRWGESVIELINFQPNDPDFGWDGRYRGQLMNPGVFVYFAEIEFQDGTVEIFKGDVVLMR